jgi:hypothetical protein
MPGIQSIDTDESWRTHLTVSRGLTPTATRAIEAAVLPALPLRCEIDDLLIARRNEDSGTTLQSLRQ